MGENVNINIWDDGERCYNVAFHFDSRIIVVIVVVIVVIIVVIVVIMLLSILRGG